MKSSKTKFALVVLGKKNLTRISSMVDGDELGLEYLAEIVRDKDPRREYYIAAIGLRSAKEIRWRWHVGEGFSHREGWWVSAWRGS